MLFLAMAAIRLVTPDRKVIGWDEVNKVPQGQLKGTYKALVGKAPPSDATDEGVKHALVRECAAMRVRILPAAEPDECWRL